MSAAASRLDIILNLIAAGDGGSLTQEQMDLLVKSSAQLTESGQRAYDALTKLDQTKLTSAADAANDVRALTAATEELKRAQSGLSNTGGGLASPPTATDVTPQGGAAMTDGQFEGAVALEAAYERLIGKKKALGEATVAEELQLEKVTAALAPYRAQLDQLQYNLQQILATRAQIANAEREKPPTGLFMQEQIEKSQQLVAARQAEMQSAQQAAASAAAQAKGKKDLADRTKEVIEAEKERKEKLAEAIKANVEDADATKKNTDGKKDLLEGLKGLSTEFPHHAQLIRAMAGVWGALAVGTAAAIAAAREYLNEIDRIEDAARAFDTVGNSVATLAENQRQLKTHNEKFAKEYEHIADEVNNAASGLERMNAALEYQHALELKVVDAEYKLELARIKASGATGPRKEQEEANALAKATARKKESDDNAEKKKLENLQASVAAAAAAERVATAQKAGVDADIPNAKRTSEIDAGRAAVIATREKERTALLEEQRKYALRIAEGKEGLFDFRNYASAASRLDKYGESSPSIASPDPDERRRKAQARVDEIDKQTGVKSVAQEKADMVATDSATKLKDLHDEQKRLDGLIETHKAEQKKWQQQLTDEAAKAAKAAPLKAQIEAAEKGTQNADQQGRNRAAILQRMQLLKDMGFLPDGPPTSVGSPPRAPKAPLPAAPISDAEVRNKARLDAAAAAQPPDPAAVATREAMAREREETRARQQKEKAARDAADAPARAERERVNQENRERWKREDAESNSRPRSGDGASVTTVDLSPLTELAASNAEVNDALVAAVQQIKADNARTIAQLGKNLQSQIRDNQT